MRNIFNVACAMGIAALFLAGLVGCGGDDASSDADDAAGDDTDNGQDDDGAPSSAEIILPPYPFWPNEAFAVDDGYLVDIATAYCARRPHDASAVDFFLGDMPLSAFDTQFCAGEDCVARQIPLGDLYLSGFFGGVWLRVLLAGAAISDLKPQPSSLNPFDNLRPVFNALAGYAAGVLASLDADSDAQIIEGARGRVTPLLLLYAYNVGFLRQIIDNPPAGLAAPDGVLDCRDDLLLDCDAPGDAWAFLSRYNDAIDSLRNPPDARWRELRDATDRAAAIVSVGADVWQHIDINGLGEDAYRQLLGLSVNFLLAGKAATLGHMTAWAESNAAEGRFALLTGAGMITWGVSYFMGLAASSSEFPTLICPAL